VFAKGASDSAIYVNSSTDGSTFSGWSTAFSGMTDKAVAPVVFDGKLHVFAKGISDNTIYVRSSTDATSWSSWLSLSGTTDAAPAAVAHNDKLIAFSKGISDNKIYFKTSTNGTSWTSWAEFGGTTEHGVRAAVFSGDLYVTSPGFDDRVYAKVTRNLTDFSSWFELPPQTHTTGAAVGVAAFGDGLYWFAQGASDDAIYEQSTPIYHLPFYSGTYWSLSQGNYDDPCNGHDSGQAYAFDFSHLEGGFVRAMRDGKVVAFAEDRTCNTWGVTSGPCFGAPGEGNFVMIEHDDGTAASYGHLMTDSVIVDEGKSVHQGDIIGLSGNTGNSSEPHLHVDVRQFWNSEFDNGPTIPFYFTASNHSITPWRPQVGDTLIP
jgi:hypothetical protein